MIAKLTDPWFEAQFTTETTAQGHRYIDTLQGADGIFFWCPCGYGKPEFPLEGGRPHGVLVHFANPRGVPVAPANAGSRNRSGAPSRWTVSGTGYADLTLTPSVDVGGAEGTQSCWHGFITNGEVT